MDLTKEAMDVGAEVSELSGATGFGEWDMCNALCPTCTMCATCPHLCQPAAHFTCRLGPLDTVAGTRCRQNPPSLRQVPAVAVGQTGSAMKQVVA